MRTFRMYAHLLTLAFVGLVVSPAALRADEGMWLYNNPPRKILKDKYNFEIGRAHV